MRTFLELFGAFALLFTVVIAMAAGMALIIRRYEKINKTNYDE